jgi:methylamine dehydrogenase accessory protein MauD
VLAARLVLAVVFALAGVAKLVDRAGTRSALADFGLPPALTRPASVMLPAAELAVAGALVPASWARVGAAGSLLLLALFSAAIAVNLARGNTPDCHCFGQLHSAPIGRATLRRNAALAALGALVLWRPGPEVGAGLAWLGDLTVAERVGLAGGLLLSAVVTLEGWAIVNLLRAQGRLLLRLDALEAMVGDHPGLPVGTVAPSFALPGLSGQTLTLEGLLAGGEPVMLLFADPYCGPCNGLLPEIGRWQRDYRDMVTIAVISRGDPDTNRARAEEHGLGQVLIQKGREVAEAYQTTATPSAVLVGPDHRITSPVVAGGIAIRRLLLRAPGVARGAPAAWASSLAEIGGVVTDEVEIHDEPELATDQEEAYG